MIAILLNDNSFEQDMRELLMAFYPGSSFSRREEDRECAAVVLAGVRSGEELTLTLEAAGEADAPYAESHEAGGTDAPHAESREAGEADASHAESREAGKTDAPGPERREAGEAAAPHAEHREAGAHVVGRGRRTAVLRPVPEDRTQAKNLIKRTLYQMLSELTGKELPWGTLTGIRPTKIALTKMSEGWEEERIAAYFKENYYTGDPKIRLCIDVARRERELLATVDHENGYSLYVGIPFCPTTCLYCSFTSFPIGKWQGRTGLYLGALFQEMDYVARRMEGRPPDTVYIGGGTPTSLSAEDLEALLAKIDRTFPVAGVKEFTVEAGRPDSITREKLLVLKEHGIGRISINPQTMKQETLDLIGRRHTVETVREKFHLARELGFDNINMDLIVGLPEETEDDVRRTMEEIKALGPDGVTVHSLAVKRAARLNTDREHYAGLKMVNTQELIDMTARYAAGMGMIPYYMYRQKNMAGNFENVGYAVPGKECIYNILIMEEQQTIMACGAGTTTKVVYPRENRLERAENVKEVEQYISRVGEMIGRKEALRQPESGQD